VALYGSSGEVLLQIDTGRVVLHPWYRVQQFLASLGWDTEPVQDGLLKAHLDAAQCGLFRRMPLSEQRHALATLRAVQRTGHTEAALAQAALLHDVGKVLPLASQGGTGGSIRLWHRVVAVLLQAIHPELLRRLAQGQPDSWRYPFFVQLHHASLGAQLAAEAGADPLAVALIRWHHSWPNESSLHPQGQALLTALQSADEEN